ncbi:MAG: hypothetical protein M1118_03990 [Chloroflexi bacterium]|nr:hypothetical protein [Chloroflexota bacterium]
MAQYNTSPKQPTRPQPQAKPLQKVQPAYPLTGQFPAKRPSVPAIKGLGNEGGVNKLAK